MLGWAGPSFIITFDLIPPVRGICFPDRIRYLRADKVQCFLMVPPIPMAHTVILNWVFGGLSRAQYIIKVKLHFLGTFWVWYEIVCLVWKSGNRRYCGNFYRNWTDSAAKRIPHRIFTCKGNPENTTTELYSQWWREKWRKLSSRAQKTPTPGAAVRRVGQKESIIRTLFIEDNARVYPEQVIMITFM